MRKIDFLVLSFSVSILSLLFGGYKTLKAICSLRGEFKAIQEERLARNIELNSVSETPQIDSYDEAVETTNLTTIETEM